MERKSKLRRLAASGVPHKKLVDIVSIIRGTDGDAEAMVSRSALRRVLDTLWNSVRSSERLVTDNGEFFWEYVSFTKLLKVLVAECPGFRGALRETFLAKPCSQSEPYHVVVYGDEIVPGNVLRLDNRRKVFAVYAYIHEMGPRYAKHESLWLPLIAIRASALKEISTGIGTCFRAMFREWFIKDRIHEQGLLLDLDLPDTRYANLYFKLGSMLADADAWRATWASKGSSGTVPCVLCRNVLKTRVSSSYLVHLSCSDSSRFDFASNEDLWEKSDTLARTASEGTKKELEELQMLYGINYSPEGILADKELRPFVKPADTITYDAMHCLVSNGICQNETALLLAALKTDGISWDMLRKFVAADWRFNRALGNATVLRGCFAKAREQAFSKGGDFKAGASEMLVVVPVMLHFSFTIVQPRGTFAKEIASYAALGNILKLFRRGKEGKAVHGELRRAIRKHADLFTAAYPEDTMQPNNIFCYTFPYNWPEAGSSWMLLLARGSIEW